MTKQTFLVTGASNGIGAVYAGRLRRETGVAVGMLAADLGKPAPRYGA